ncbi:MAG: hypothetical protein IIZ30_07485 [Sphingomonas sp.]|uniref:hypothetical protein n=1 Tax=Sphingomonas sp. TaxID=28214 RepID=UPI00257E42E1|nr:hypothetical protein [Sphingomonas sp.]MBQ1479863.1 hypothetical protein [Sphingomonas sp.]
MSKVEIDFRECPNCGGYGVRDNGDNCTTCGGVGHGGLRSGPGICIGSGEIMVDRQTRRVIGRDEFVALTAEAIGTSHDLRP